MPLLLPLVLSLALAAPPSQTPAPAKGAVRLTDEVPSWVKPSDTSSDALDLDFPGGSLADYYRGVSSTTQGKALPPLVLSDLAERVRLQPVSMHGASPLTLYELPTKLVHGGVTLQPLVANDREGVARPTALVVGVDPDIVRQRPPAVTFDLDFPGGTVASYADAVRKAAPKANLVILGGADKFPVPAMKFRDVTVDAAARAIEGQQRNPDGTMSSLSVRPIEIGGSPEGVYKIELETSSSGPRGEEFVRVWSLADVLQAGAKVEDVLSAIEAALAVEERPAKVKYHEATNILIVRATERQQKIVNDVIGQVQQTVIVRQNAQQKK